MGQPRALEAGGVVLSPEGFTGIRPEASGRATERTGRRGREIAGIAAKSITERLASVRAAISHEARGQKKQERVEARLTREQTANSVLDQLKAEHEGNSPLFDYEHEPQDLLQAVHEAEAIADRCGFRMIVVGGSGLARFVDKQPDVQISEIDHTNHNVTLSGAKDPGIHREDGTTTDIDTIVVRKDGLDPFTDQTRTDYKLLQTALNLHVARRTKHVGTDGQPEPLRTPSIAVETASYHPPFPQPGLLKRLTNFNSRIDVYQGKDGQEHWFATLGSIKTRFDEELMQTWRVKFADRPNDPGIPTLMIPAYIQRFRMRGPVVKEKDKKKIGPGSVLANLSRQFYQRSGDMAKHYRALMTPWEEFTQQIQDSPKLLIQRQIYRLWWKYVGERIAHESGFFGVVLQPYRGWTNGEIKFYQATKEALPLMGNYLKDKLLHR